ncbi:hypothetical protein [Chromobacterium piscinae]|uniref:hypothetical protein n=1 Tax=Chromobacterium piscinae TaxID=686831 RepID=UPI003F7D926E
MTNIIREADSKNIMTRLQLRGKRWLHKFSPTYYFEVIRIDFSLGFSFGEKREGALPVGRDPESFALQ